jgi:hypothetical protein
LTANLSPEERTIVESVVQTAEQIAVKKAAEAAAGL